MDSMFEGDSSLTRLDLSNFNTSNALNMRSMFAGLSSITALDVSNLNIDKAGFLGMSNLFAGDTSLVLLNLSFDTRGFIKSAETGPSKIPAFQSMLSGLTSLTVLILSPNTLFKADESFVGNPNLGSPAGSSNWRAVAADRGGTLSNPKGLSYSPTDLIALYHVDNASHPTKNEIWVPENGINDQSAISAQPTYSIPVGTKFDPSTVFISLTTLDKQIITNYQDALKAGMTVSGDQFDTNNTGTHTVTFNYFDKKATTQVTVTSSGGGGNSTPTPSPQPTPNPTPTPKPETPVTPPTPVQPSNPVIPNYAAKKGAAVYGINSLYLYKNANFTKGQRIAKYVKKPRIYRPMFVVTDYACSTSGKLRYKVRDVNHLSKTAGKMGYITANWQYVRPVYYATKHSRITVISPQGVNAYKRESLTGKVKNYKQGTVLKVKGMVKHNLTTRYILTNGKYVTANRKLVNMGRHKTVKKVRAKTVINRYKDVNLSKRNQTFNKGKVFKVYNYDYSHGYNLQKHGTLRYCVAGGYITGNSKYVKVIR